MKRQARITGPVEYREGDGPQMPIRPGPIEYEESELDVTLAWVDGDTHGSAAMPRNEWQRYVDSGAIQLQS